MRSCRTNKLQAPINHISAARRSTPHANQNSAVERLQASYEASWGTPDTLQAPPRIRPRWRSNEEIGRRALEAVHRIQQRSPRSSVKTLPVSAAIESPVILHTIFAIAVTSCRD